MTHRTDCTCVVVAVAAADGDDAAAVVHDAYCGDGAYHFHIDGMTNDRWTRTWYRDVIAVVRSHSQQYCSQAYQSWQWSMTLQLSGSILIPWFSTVLVARHSPDAGGGCGVGAGDDDHVGLEPNGIAP
mgnify:CR=1 FL=1